MNSYLNKTLALFGGICAIHLVIEGTYSLITETGFSLTVRNLIVYLLFSIVVTALRTGVTRKSKGAEYGVSDE